MKYTLVEGIKKSEFRHNKRICDIAVGSLGRNKELIELCRNIENLIEIEHQYLIYIPSRPNTESEIIAVLAENLEKKENDEHKDPKFEVVPPVNNEEMVSKLEKLEDLYNKNEICIACESLSEECRFFSENLKYPNILIEKDTRIISDLVTEFVEINKSNIEVFIRKLAIPQFSVISSLPEYSIYKGCLIIVSETDNLQENSHKICTDIQMWYKKTLKKLEEKPRSIYSTPNRNN